MLLCAHDAIGTVIRDPAFNTICVCKVWGRSSCLFPISACPLTFCWNPLTFHNPNVGGGLSHLCCTIASLSSSNVAALRKHCRINPSLMYCDHVSKNTLQNTPQWNTCLEGLRTLTPGSCIAGVGLANPLGSFPLYHYTILWQLHYRKQHTRTFRTHCGRTPVWRGPASHSCALDLNDQNTVAAGLKASTTSLQSLPSKNDHGNARRKKLP